MVLLYTCRYGFGNISADSDFWWGLENMYNITNEPYRKYRLRIDMINSNGTLYRAEHEQVQIQSEKQKYRIVRGYTDKFKSNITNYITLWR